MPEAAGDLDGQKNIVLSLFRTDFWSERSRESLTGCMLFEKSNGRTRSRAGAPGILSVDARFYR
jgi:hypothetical protein